MSWQEERKLRQEIVAVHRKLYELGFSVANDGNTSVRVEKERILVTPRGLNKARLEPNQMALVDLAGQHVGGPYLPSTEIAMHLEIYKARPDVRAIIHAHPPYSIACSLAGVSLEEFVLPEIVLTLGTVPTTPYATTGTPDVAKAVEAFIKKHDAVILERHGTVTVGASLDEAMLKLERVEHTAKIIVLARAMGGAVTPLPRPEVERLARIAGGAAVEALKPAQKDAPGNPNAELVELITREVVAALGHPKPSAGKDS